MVAEVEGEGDAAAEENTPQTPGVVNEDGGWGAPVISATEADANTASAGDGGWGAADTSATGAEAVPVSTTDGGWGAPTTSAPGGAEGDTAFATTAEPEAPAEPEEIQKSYDEFLAERARAALSAGLGKKEGRLVNAETLEGKAFRREAANDVYFAGKVGCSYPLPWKGEVLIGSCVGENGEQSQAEEGKGLHRGRRILCKPCRRPSDPGLRGARWARWRARTWRRAWWSRWRSRWRPRWTRSGGAEGCWE